MDDNYHIFIASCFEGLDVQVPRIIKNILDVNIPVNYVHIIVGGCPYEKTYNINGIEIVHITYRCFEFTPLIYIVNNPDKYNFNYAFFTHDTVLFGNNFYNIIKNDIVLLKGTSYNTQKIDNNLPSMNIGIYHKNIILKNKEKLLELSLNTNDNNELIKLKNLLVHCEDFILNQSNYNNRDTSVNIVNKFTGINGVVSNGLIRNFNRIDFIKYQSNAYHIQSIDICNICG